MKRDLNDINGRIAATRRAEWQRSALIVRLRYKKDEPETEWYQGAGRSDEKGNSGQRPLQDILRLG
jgi:hypothetical protein